MAYLKQAIEKVSRIVKTLFFETDNIYIQDGSMGEYEVGQTREFDIEARALTQFEKADIQTSRYEHIKDADYKICGSIYRKSDCFAFMSLGDFNVVICRDAEELQEGVFYKAIVRFFYDIWNCYHLEIRSMPNITQKGVVQSIALDTSIPIKCEKYQNAQTKDGVERKYDISLQKTSCWMDEERSNVVCNYLIETLV